MQRILVIGICGAGKSVLARELARRLDLPLIHLDREFWQPGWNVPDPAWWDERVRQLASGDRWVIDGSYTSTLHHRLPRADTVIYLDFPRRIALYRILKRIILSYGRTRPDLADGCPEQFDWELLKYAWNFHRAVTPQIEECMRDLADGMTCYRLRRPSQVRQFLRNLPEQTEC